ncbi:hypothetical protein CAOG_008424 [Capsaspora owczarzaki ATCC 30864]|uniref:Uncharacterized protein n=1 Tax=Capsaspora owczarzaki (strain ATCC 30864) TaxID=595528 RepID=A0A0D2U171_CAPO3|nr:hypothetical protein CAOG_008424 [Capsaspora owczarzaki ATCC 30864]
MVEDRRQSLWRPYPVARLPQLTAHIVEDHPTPGCATVTLTSSDEAAVPSSSFVADFATLAKCDRGRKCLASIQTMLLENQPAHLQLLFRVMADSPHKTSYAAWVATGEAILADMDAASAASASSSTTTTAQETQAQGTQAQGTQPLPQLDTPSPAVVAASLATPTTELLAASPTSWYPHSRTLIRVKRPGEFLLSKNHGNWDDGIERSYADLALMALRVLAYYWHAGRLPFDRYLIQTADVPTQMMLLGRDVAPKQMLAEIVEGLNQLGLPLDEGMIDGTNEAHDAYALPHLRLYPRFDWDEWQTYQLTCPLLVRHLFLAVWHGDIPSLRQKLGELSALVDSGAPLLRQALPNLPFSQRATSRLRKSKTDADRTLASVLTGELLTSCISRCQTNAVTLLHLAVLRRHADVIRILVTECGMPVELGLWAAVRYGLVDMARLMVELGATPTRFLLDGVVRNLDCDMLRFLVAAGGVVTARELTVYTLEHDIPRADFLQALLELGAPIDAQVPARYYNPTSGQSTRPHLVDLLPRLAAKSTRIVPLLLSYGARRGARAALQHALLARDLEVFRLLLQSIPISELDMHLWAELTPQWLPVTPSRPISPAEFTRFILAVVEYGLPLPNALPAADGTEFDLFANRKSYDLAGLSDTEKSIYRGAQFAASSVAFSEDTAAIRMLIDHGNGAPWLLLLCASVRPECPDQLLCQNVELLIYALSRLEHDAAALVSELCLLETACELRSASCVRLLRVLGIPANNSRAELLARFRAAVAGQRRRDKKRGVPERPVTEMLMEPWAQVWIAMLTPPKMSLLNSARRALFRAPQPLRRFLHDDAQHTFGDLYEPIPPSSELLTEARVDVNMRRATRSPVWWLLSLLVVARVSSGQEQAACTFCTCVGSPVIEVKNCNDALITIPSNIPTTVKNMWIDNTFIRFIRPAAFRDLSSLTVLGLYGNQISVIPANAFSGLVSLKVLDLRENGISDLSARAFTGLSALTLLQLSWTGLTTVPRGMLAGLTSLQRLELQNNLLSTLPPGLFQNLSALTQVDLSGNSFGAVAPPSTYRVLTSLNKCSTRCDTCYGAGPDACCATYCLSCNSTNCTSCYVGSVMVDGVCGPPAPLQIIAASFPATALEGNEIQGVITLHNYGNTSLDNVKLGMYPGYGLQLDLYDQQQKPVPYLLQAEVQQAITRLASETSLDGYIDDIGQVSLAAGQTLAFPVKFVFQGPAFPLLFFSRYDAWSLLVQDTSNSVGVIWRMEPQETNIAVSPIANDAELVLWLHTGDQRDA